LRFLFGHSLAPLSALCGLLITRFPWPRRYFNSIYARVKGSCITEEHALSPRTRVVPGGREQTINWENSTCRFLAAAETGDLKANEPKQRKRKDRDAIMRVGVSGIELVKRGAARYDFRDPYHIAVEMSWKEFALAFLGLELCINIAFALLYFASPGCIANMRPGSFSDAFFFSIETLATVGYGVMAPATLYGHVISAIEIVCGLVFTAIMTGLLFVRFSKPRPKILFADQAVVTSHNGAPTLMVRIANGRMTLLTNAVVRLGVILFEESAEGRPFRRLHDLALSNATLSLFPLTWTLMHEINENSPLVDYDATRFKEDDARLFLTIEARDHAIGTPIHDMRVYTVDEVVFGMHYAEAVTVDDQRRPVADLSRLSLIEPDESDQPE
jgi:inward rectifier potassium channel